mmetsp:Transcript_22623/g.38761  ORF Transcript_22623/g.38761 Transcript_22623/m.38761 type:complete len:208 (-) Transcript_22623:539-1162(-)
MPSKIIPHHVCGISTKSLFSFHVYHNSSFTPDFLLFTGSGVLGSNPSISPITGTSFNGASDPILVTFTVAKNVMIITSNNDLIPNPPPPPLDFLSCERDVFAPCFSNAVREAISRFKSRFVCSKVLLRISRSAVKLTENATSSSYLRRSDATSSYNCSGLIFSVLLRLSTPSRKVAGREDPGGPLAAAPDARGGPPPLVGGAEVPTT